MSDKIFYEYDAECGVLIKDSAGGPPKIMRKRDPHWNDLGPNDDLYARAIYLGQGCWERLDSITEEKAQQIMSEWGYSPENEV